MMAQALPASDPPAFDPEALPRLVYFADVPVENYMHGSALIYRLLERYPPDKLLIVEGLVRSQADRRLPGVRYAQSRHPMKRVLQSRFGGPLTNLYASVGGDGVGALRRALGDFVPDAVLTVIHGYQWQGAAAYARAQGIPLHVIAHDRWQDTFSASDVVKARIAPRFAQAYRDAISRFCVSPHMAEVYEAETGAAGEVLYPARRRSFAPPTTASLRATNPGRPFTVAYAGSIHDGGLIEALALMASVLATLGARLLVFGPYTAEQLAERGLKGDNIIVGGSVAPADLAQRLRAEADLLAASVSFDPAIRSAMEMCFPSKLTDYTAAGLPILVHGPASCSAMRWADDNPNLAETVRTMDTADMTAALERLIGDSGRRLALAQAALDLGERQFGGEVAEQTLFGALVRA